MSEKVVSAEDTFFPEDFDQMLDLSRFLRETSEPAALIGPDGQQVGLPENVYQILLAVVEAMSAGLAVTVAPVDQKLTTGQAADFLGISRPTLVKLLEDGHIPYEKPNRHRRIQLQDLLAYRDHKRAERAAILDELTAEAYADDTYFALPTE